MAQYYRVPESLEELGKKRNETETASNSSLHDSEISELVKALNVETKKFKKKTVHEHSFTEDRFYNTKAELLK